VLAFLVVQPIVGIENGVAGARNIHASELRSAETAKNISKVSDIDVLDHLNFYQPVSLTKMQVGFAETLHLTLFAQK
jgi:hypothetical protein